MSNLASEPEYIIALWQDGYAEQARNYNKQLGAFKPVTKSFINKLAISGKNKQNIYGITPKNLVGFRQIGENYKIVFTTPKKVYSILGSKKKYNVTFPKMMWFYDSGDHELHIYAYNSLAKNSSLFHINYSNVSQSRVCIGTCPKPCSETYSKVIEETQAMFFDGEFTHGNYKRVYVAEKEGGTDLWKNVSKYLNTL